LFGLFCFAPCVIEAFEYEGVETRVPALNPGDRGLQDFDGRKAPLSHSLGKLGCAHIGELVAIHD
jgi:hypothetical protein